MARNIFDLSGRVAVITGGGDGLGRAMAVGFARHGANVVAADLDLDGTKVTAGLVEKEGGQALAQHCDVTSQEDVDSLVANTMDKFGTIDILVNSAGTTNHIPPVTFPLTNGCASLTSISKGRSCVVRRLGGSWKKTKGAASSISRQSSEW